MLRNRVLKFLIGILLLASIPFLLRSDIHAQHLNSVFEKIPVVEAFLMFVAVIIAGLVLSKSKGYRNLTFSPLNAIEYIAYVGFISLLLFIASLYFPIEKSTTVVFFLVPNALLGLNVFQNFKNCKENNYKGLYIDQLNNVYAYFYWGTIVYLSWLIFRLVLWQLVCKNILFADEASFWFPSAMFMASHGFTEYVANYPVSNYLPGYPLLVNSLLGIVPESLFTYFFKIVPVAIGLVLMIFAMFQSLNNKNKNLFDMVCILSIGALFFGNGWITDLMLSLWYGEAMAALLFCLLLYLNEHMSSLQQLSCYKKFVIFFFAVFVSLSKPPLSSLFIPLCALYIISYFIINRTLSIVLLKANLIMVIGFVAGAEIWSRVLKDFNKAPYYKIELNEIAVKPDFAPVYEIASHISVNYKYMLIIYFLTIVIGLVLDVRRYLSPILISLSIVVVVLILYATAWRNVEYLSAGRYISSVCIGWVVYFLNSAYHNILSLYESPTVVAQNNT